MKPPAWCFLVLPFLFSPFVNATEKNDYFKRISFHSPTNSGFRTATILNAGFTGATVTMSSNHEALNLNDVVFSVAHDWLDIRPHQEGRVTLVMKRQPQEHELANTLTLRNRKTGNTQHYPFIVNTWLIGEGTVDNNFATARERCQRMGGRLLTTHEFREVSRKWFGLSHGQLSERYPLARLFHPQAQAGGSFWVHEAKALHLHTGIKSHQRGINTVCRYNYAGAL